MTSQGNAIAVDSSIARGIRVLTTDLSPCPHCGGTGRPGGVT